MLIKCKTLQDRQVTCTPAILAFALVPAEYKYSTP